jgi:hypothetical protein
LTRRAAGAGTPFFVVLQKKFFGMRGLGSVQMKPFTVAYLLREYFRGMSG